MATTPRLSRVVALDGPYGDLEELRPLQRHLKHRFRLGGQTAGDLQPHAAGLVRRAGHKEGQRDEARRLGAGRRRIVHDVEVTPGHIVVVADEAAEIIPVEEIRGGRGRIARRADQRHEAIMSGRRNVGGLPLDRIRNRELIAGRDGRQKWSIPDGFHWSGVSSVEGGAQKTVASTLFAAEPPRLRTRT